MSDPKTSQNNQVAFQDRLYVAGNATFVCLIVAALWTVILLTKSPFSFETLVMLAAPLVATGVVVLLFGMVRDLVPSSSLASPLNLSIPVIWCLICYLTVHLISTQETGSTTVHEGLMPVLVWANLSTLLPVMMIQVFLLSIFVLVGRKQA